MKKNREKWLFSPTIGLKKFFMMMKLTFLMCVMSISSMYASVYSQEKVTIDRSEVTIKELFNEFQRQTHKIVIYNDDAFAAGRRVDVKLVDAGIDQFMSEVLKGSGMTYQVENDYILIVPAKQLKEVIAAPQENRTIKGTVIDKDGITLPGVSVVVTGTTIGVSTDMDGNFTLIVPASAKTITVSFVGMATQEVAVSEQMKIVLQPDSQQLDEVVVVGYNTVKKSQMTGALDVLKAEKIEKASSPTLENRLQGQVPGLMISNNSGQPGSSDVTIRIRGTGSMNGSNTPLYIMDGVMVEAAQFAALNSNDIDDIQVLKDASATAIYGSRGANGVIVITTKTGKAGKTRFNYQSRYGFSKFRSNLELMNGPENIEFQRMCAETFLKNGQYDKLSLHPLVKALAYEMKEEAGTITADELDYLNQNRETLASARATNTDWLDVMTRNGFTMEHSLSASGGDERTKFFISGSYLKNDGILNGTSLERISGRFNISHKVNEYLNFGVKYSLGHTKSNEINTNEWSWANPWFTTLLAFPYQNPDEWYSKDNPSLVTKYRHKDNQTLKMVGSAFVNVNITDWLSVKTNFGMDYKNVQGLTSQSADHPASQSNKGSLSKSNSNLLRYTWTNTVNINKVFGDRHALNGVVGMEMFQGRYDAMNYTGYGLDKYMEDTPAGIGDKTGASLNPPQIGGSKTMSNLLSYFGQISYSLDNKYTVSASLRYDSSSKFQEDNRSATFWSLGASWNMQSEDFMSGASDWLEQLKLRVSYGTTGNQDGVSDFGTYDGYAKKSYAGQTGYYMNQLGNPDLKWETSGQFNAGFDFSMFSNRFSGTFDFYNKKTKDLFMDKEISQTSGFTSIQTNAGSIVNRGIELTLNGTLIRTAAFQWDLGLNFTYNHNEIVELAEWNKAGFVNGDTYVKEGVSLGTWYMKEFGGVNPANGNAWFIDANGNKTEKDGEAPEVMKYGSSEVPYFGGFNTTLSYKGLSLYVLFNYAFDYTIMNGNRWYIDNPEFNGNKPKKLLSMWMKPGDVTNIPSVGSEYNCSPWASQFLEDGDYLRLKTMRLSYSLPQNWLKRTNVFDAISVYAQAENLWTCTNYSGSDPEVGGGTDNALYPQPFVMTFGLDINF